MTKHNKELNQQIKMLERQKEIEANKELQLLEQERNGSITDNDKYFYENATGKPIAVRDIMTPQAKRLRKGIFEYDSFSDCQYEGTN